MKNEKKVSQILFIIYLILLSWIILMKTQFSVESIYRMQSLNLVPLAGTAIRNNQLDYQEIYLNILIFVPFGIFVSTLKPDWNFLKRLFPIFLTSLLFESLQYLFSIGASDITDLIANTIGGALGILAYFIVLKVLKKKTNYFFNLLAVAGTLFFIFIYVVYLV